jgi:hypothetical protein
MATQQRANMLDIIKHDAESSGGNFDQVYDALKSGIDSGKMRVLRHGNTLMIYTIHDRGVAEIHIATLDNPQQIIEAFKSFYHAFKVAGFTTLFADIDNPQIIRLVEMSKIPFEMKQQQGLGGHTTYQLTIRVK